MFVILIYDIQTIQKAGKRRLPKILKLCRQFLHHTQKSVFEGEITEAKLKELQIKIKNLIDRKKDYVVIYRIDNINNLKRKDIGLQFDPNSNIL